MNALFTKLKGLKAFVKDRPNLKVKIDEVLSILGIPDYVQCNPAIKNINVRGGRERFDDNGNTTDGSYGRFDDEMQEITFAVALIDGKSLNATVTQKKNNDYKVVVRVNYSEGSYGGKKGKEHFTSLIDAVTAKIEGGVNPYQDDLNKAKANNEYRQREFNELQAELDILEKIKESVPTAYREIKSKLTSKRYEVQRTTEDLKDVQTKFDKCKV